MGHPILESPLLFPRTVCSYLSEGKEEKTMKKETGKPVWKTKAPKSFTRGCQGGKQTHRQAHLYPLSSGVFITEPGNILFPLGGGLEGARLHPSTFPGCGTERGLSAARAETPHITQETVAELLERKRWEQQPKNLRVPA